MSARILIIDDDPSVPAVIAEVLESMGHTVAVASDGPTGLRLASESPFDLVLVDLVMPRMNGAEVTERLIAQRPDTRIVVISGHPNDPLAKQALAAGAQEVVGKPFEIAALLDLLE